MLSLSTCWNNSRHHCGRELIAETREMGFDWVELSHGMTISKLPGFQEAWEAGEMKVSGVHNFFPSPVEVMIDAPDAYEYSSHRPHERERALDLTKRTLEVGQKFGASYLVIHLGSVPMKSSKWTKPLTKLVKAGKQLSPEFLDLKMQFVKKRDKLGPLYVQRAIEAMEAVADLAKEAGIKLALESRSRFEDVPTEDEMIYIQEHFKDNPWIGYWHDFGHVQLKHNLGLLDHEQWLAKMQPYCIGAHVHDVYWPERDHRVPLTGTLDFKKLLNYIPEDAPHVWELSPSRDKDEILEALAVWRAAFPNRS